MRFLVAVSLLAAAALAAPCTMAARAQQPKNDHQPTEDGLPRSDSPLFTLHVYTNLVQIPALVLDTDGKPLPRLAREQFSLSLDSGPTFHPTHIRSEGPDPISLSILLAANDDEIALVKAFDAALPVIAPSTPADNTLGPRDSVSIYAYDCTIQRSAFAIPPNAEALRLAVRKALDSPHLHRAARTAVDPKPPCALGGHLWEAIIRVVHDNSQRPGRRALLVIADGEDLHNLPTWSEVSRFASERSVSVFGLQIKRLAAMPFRPRVTTALPTNESVSPFASLCLSSGGVLEYTTPLELSKSLLRFVSLLRTRYILEFPRASNSTPGSHQLAVTVPQHRDAFVASGGITVPLPDDSILNDPNTLPSDPTRAPIEGKRRPLKQP